LSDDGDNVCLLFDRALVCLKLNSSVYPGHGFPYVKQRLHVGLASSHCIEVPHQLYRLTQ
jgi:hypothetical protein